MTCASDCTCGRHGKGLSKHPAYGVWQGMMSRCFQPSQANFKNYGGRGITVAEEWRSSENFLHYLDTVLGPRLPGYSLDRIDNNGNYEPGNVQWSTRSKQSENRRPRKKRLRVKKIGQNAWAIR